jgi:hypothetical protein
MATALGTQPPPSSANLSARSLHTLSSPTYVTYRPKYLWIGVPHAFAGYAERPVAGGRVGRRFA